MQNILEANCAVPSKDTGRSRDALTDDHHQHQAHGHNAPGHECSRCNVTAERLRDQPAERLPRVEERKEAARTPAEEKRINDFQNKHAVDVTLKGKEYEYKISVNGADKVLFTTDATPKGLDDAEAKLAKLVQDKQDELNKTFKVTFSKEGDDVIQQWIEKPDCTWERGPMIKARSPQLLELYGIEAAIYRSQPSQLDKTSAEAIKFHFLKDNYYKDQPVLAYYISSDKDGKPSVYFEPGANKDKPATEEDANRFNRHQLFSIEALTIHELAHNHQKKTGWYEPAEKEKLARSIGWIPFVDPKTNEQDWLLKGKDGELYRRGKDHCKDTHVWVKCSKNGEPLDDKDKPVAKFKDAKKYTRDEVTARALVPPVTYYFVNPTEMFAEGLMFVRLDQKRREELLKASPVLFEACKKQDQEELNLNYGKNGDGSPKYIRSADGKVVENNAANRKEVDDFEQKVKAKKDKK